MRLTDHTIRNCGRWLALATTLLASSPAPRKHCFTVAVRLTDVERRVFEERHCQGGGVTWAALLQVLVLRIGPVAPVEQHESNWNGDVFRLNQRATFAIDDEGDEALFCSDDKHLVDRLEKQVARLRKDETDLKAAMAESSAEALECFGPGDAGTSHPP